MSSLSHSHSEWDGVKIPSANKANTILSPPHCIQNSPLAHNSITQGDEQEKHNYARRGKMHIS